MATHAPLRLSVVEQSFVRKGGSGRDALTESVELARFTEQLGYERFWVAEHHNLPGVASISPEILVGQVGAATSTIRVGSGGVMLPHYSAFKVAENFRTLETLFPGRVDLGLGRAPGGDPKTAAALAHPRAPIDIRSYPEQVEDLIGYLEDDLAPNHPFRGLKPGPPTEHAPEVWLLGSGIDSARLAAQRGLPFAFAHFFGNSAQGPAIVEHYRTNFRPSKQCAAPNLYVAVQMFCAETVEEATWHAKSLDISRVRMARNEPSAGIVSAEEAANYVFTPEELHFLEHSGIRATIGDPDTIAQALKGFSEEYGTDQFGVVSICFDWKARLRSYELLAEMHLPTRS